MAAAERAGGDQVEEVLGGFNIHWPVDENFIDQSLHKY
jgi:hypothetical protein